MLLVAACGSPATAPGTTTSTSAPSEAIAGSVVPAVASVVTPQAAGSAVYLEPGVLVTNAHVVWPHDEVAVRFPGGATATVAVLRIDWVADLAILDTAALSPLPAPVPIRRGPPPPVGDAAVLVGRSTPEGDGVRVAPGAVTGTRTWGAAAITLVETDIPISDGQSGGVITDPEGQVLGMTGLSEGGLAIALSADDLADRLETPAGDGPGDRRMSALVGRVDEPVTPENLLDEAVFVIDGTTAIDLTLPPSGFEAAVVGSDGVEESRALDTPRLTVSPAGPPPYFAVLTPLVPAPGPVVPGNPDGTVRPLLDPDRGRSVEIGGRTVGNADYPGDLDWYMVELRAGDRIEIVASSIGMDPALVVSPVEGLGPDTVVVEGGGGGGPLGWDARLVYVASRTGTHVVGVYDEGRFGPGAYVLTIGRTG